MYFSAILLVQDEYYKKQNLPIDNCRPYGHLRNTNC